MIQSADFETGFGGKLTIPPCGAYCGSCVAYKRNCAGCIETDGRPFHLEQVKVHVCPVWLCTKSREIEHCGVCDEFPCEEFLSWYDPARGIITVLRRAGLLMLRKKIGADAWIKWIREKEIKFGA
jgi:hypothetical protein